jgi:hypothetical protein
VVERAATGPADAEPQTRIGVAVRMAPARAGRRGRSEVTMSETSRVNFVLQQGFREASPDSCGVRYPALMWQPRVIGVIVAVGLLLQSWPVFLVLSAVLWWNVLVPRLNPFDALYNRLIARPRNLPRLTPAPAPRRFSQAMAASFNLAIGLALMLGHTGAAYVLEVFLVVALTALVFGRFCLGSYIWHLVTGEARFANHTLPWVKSA